MTFRLYGYVDAVSGTSGLHGGNMSIFAANNAVGQFATPEPGGIGLLGGAGLLLLAASRFRKRR